MAAADGTWATSPPTRPRRDLLLALAVPVLLAIIAGVQVVRAATLDQSSWSGAGFGMFATWDNEDSRFVRAYLRTDEERKRVPIPADLADVVFDAKVVPTDERLATLGRRLLDRLDSVPAGAVVEVEVWAIHVEGADQRLNVSAAPRWTATSRATLVSASRLVPPTVRTLVDRDPLDLIAGGSLLLLILNTNENPPLFVASIVLTVVAIVRPPVPTHPATWLAAASVLAIRYAWRWEGVDNHVIVTAYWCAALGLSLLAVDRARVLATNARLIVGLVFAFAAAWKLGSGEFVDGTFFRYTLLVDDRFETLARLVGGTSGSALQANVDAIATQRDAGVAGAAVVLAEGPRNAAVAQAMTWWAIVSEAFVAITFLAPLRNRWTRLRHGGLFAFAFTTYAAVPIGGFGCLLLVMGAAQTRSRRLIQVYVIAFAALVVWSILWRPILG